MLKRDSSRELKWKLHELMQQTVKYNIRVNRCFIKTEPHQAACKVTLEVDPQTSPSPTVYPKRKKLTRIVGTIEYNYNIPNKFIPNYVNG